MLTRFSETEAKAQQVGHRTIGRYRAIYLSLGENYLLRLRGTSLDTVVQLETISRLPRDDRSPYIAKRIRQLKYKPKRVGIAV